MQSVAVRLIVEREREIEAFKPEEYWKIAAVAAAAQAGRQDRWLRQPRPVARRKPREAQGEEPSRRGRRSRQRRRPSPKTPTLPEGAFVAELAEWDGKKFKADSQEADRSDRRRP